MTIAAVVFDLDGTLLDTEMLSVETMTEISGPKYSLELHKRILGMPCTQWTRIVIDELQLSITPEDFARKWHEILSTKFSLSVLLSGALKLVQSLQSQPIKVALATSSTSKAVAIKRSVHPELFEGFEVIVCGDDEEVIQGKPSPDIFLVAAKRLGITDYSRCVVVEDSPNGVAGGCAAGMQVVAIPDMRFYAPQDIPEKFGNANFVLKSLEDWNTLSFH